ncbi:unnamed protein product [Linum trigynum]|uniref:Non-LTR retroelement reverse transcriptase n=1 Tax=Linum trigynum TaxID=586398 RepID=A0AAV2E6R3_9ROSI
MGFDKHLRVDAIGFSGGIWVLWKGAVFSIIELDRDSQFLHFTCTGPNNVSVILTAIYAKPNDHDRTPLWAAIRRLEQNITQPWLLAGDFNSITCPSERNGGAKFNPHKTLNFNDCIRDCALVDVGFNGPKFTWSNGKLSQPLDRALCNQEWIRRFPDTLANHLPKLRSDHRPIFIQSNNNHVPSRQVRPFRFLVPWLTHKDFLPTLEASWHRGRDCLLSLQELQGHLTRWNKEVFGNIFLRKAKLSAKLARLEIQNENSATEASLRREGQAREELEQTLWQEELLWLQKARNNHILNGDRNTRYFHTAALTRRRKNRITKLQTADGIWVDDPDELRSMARDFYVELFTDDCGGQQQIPACFNALTETMTAHMADIPTLEETHKVIKEMGGLKAPGKDGFHAAFYQKCWNNIGADFYDHLIACFRNPDRIRLCNDTLLVLLPKVDLPKQIAQFRPIGLCNVSYKALAKCLANRLKEFMPQLVDQNQSSFVPKRHITDNIIILQEVVHSLSLKTGAKGSMILKIDLAKAYDRINWKFLESTLMAAGIPDDFVKLVMACVTTARFQVLWNGGCTESFQPTRGLRQGCPLSPYLFTLCIERLNHCIKESIDRKAWKSITLSKDGPPLTHLFFADDLVLFAEADQKQGEEILACLDRFCGASGERVNKDKSCVFFSKNTKDQVKTRISDTLGIQQTNNLGRYLGVPVIHGRVTKDTYKYILEKIDKRLSGWKARSLSLAGRVTLAVSVLNALPNYVMQTAVLPISVCDTIDRKVRAFVWGAEEGRGKAHLVKWETICKPKEEGGLGLRSARALNLAYLMKLGWAFLNKSDDLWIRVMQGKYFKLNDNGDMVMKKSNFSRLWKGIVETWPIVKERVVWDIRAGRNIHFWTDPWLAEGIILRDHTTNGEEGINWHASVADMTTNQGEWNWEKIKPYLTQHLISLVAGTDPPIADSGEDITTWGMEPDGKFKLRSAYIAAADWIGDTELSAEDETPQPHWKRLWKWTGPNRIKHFLWLVFHDRLMTNAERERRKLTNDDTCSLCKSGPETTEHILRLCPSSQQVWRRLGINDTLLTCGLGFTAWLESHLGNEKEGLLFGVAAWYLWKRRNEKTFHNLSQEDHVLAHRIGCWTNTIRNAHLNDEASQEQPSTKTTKQLAWNPPPVDWMSIHTDGSVKQPGSLAAAGGLIRDWTGRCVEAFVENLGVCTITRAEIMAAIRGLQVAWRKGFRKVQLNLDSTTAISVLTSSDQTEQRYFNLVQQFKGLLHQNWEVRISHTYRECNKPADYLASRGHLVSIGFHDFRVNDPGLAFWLLYDTMGIAQTRLI